MWDWRYPIDEIRKEVRKARSQGNALASLDGIDNLLDDLSSSFSRLEAEDNKKKTEEEELKEFFKSQREMITHSYEHGKQYANIIVIGGYAGLFTMWSFTKGQLEKWQVLSVGLCMLLSFIFFLVFELYSSWLRSTQVIRQINELDKAEKLNKLPDEYGKSELNRLSVFLKVWPYFFFLAVGFALVAALILGYSFICGLINA